MDDVLCNLIYVDRSVQKDRLIYAPVPGSDGLDGFDEAAQGCETNTLRDNVALLLKAVGDG